MPREYWFILGTAVLLAAVVIVEHLTLGRWWARHEYERRAVGTLTVFIFALTLAVLGVLDLFTVIVLFGLFGIAGATLLTMRTDDKTNVTTDTITAMEGGRDGHSRRVR